LISQGSGGHGYVFAELADRVHQWGFNVFIMPKHGGRTIIQLMSRHLEVLQYVRAEFNDRIGLYGEGLGGYVAFYLALTHAPIVSLICQNAPAILTEPGLPPGAPQRSWALGTLSASAAGHASAAPATSRRCTTAPRPCLVIPVLERLDRHPNRQPRPRAAAGSQRLSKRP
jgi:pimeloyl-ACP methyl ester carboxylesterase